MTHHVKCVQPHFDDVWEGRKTFEVRRDDRDYQSGDTLVQHEHPPKHTGERVAQFEIGHILRDFVGLRKGWCAFALIPKPFEDWP